MWVLIVISIASQTVQQPFTVFTAKDRCDDARKVIEENINGTTNGPRVKTYCMAQ